MLKIAEEEARLKREKEEAELAKRKAEEEAAAAAEEGEAEADEARHQVLVGGQHGHDEDEDAGAAGWSGLGVSLLAGQRRRERQLSCRVSDEAWGSSWLR